MFKAILFRLPSALSLFLFLSLSTAQAKGPVASPEATTELICHTQHASECYPAIFQPTERFQIIHDDQSIPPGLHVRMNLATGLKEARLNIPEPEDAPKADIVIVDNTPVRLAADEEAEAEPITPLGIQDQSKLDRVYDYLRPSMDPEESSLFASETSKLRSSSVPTLETLSALTDLVHSYDWGLALAQDGSLIHKLIETLQPVTIQAPNHKSETFQPIVTEKPLEIRSATALLLGTAIQNNPEALAALLTHTKPDTESSLEFGVTYAVLCSLSIPLEQSSPFLEVQLHQRTLFLLHQLASSPTQLGVFIGQNGLNMLYGLFTYSNTTKLPAWGDPIEPPKIIPGDDGRDKLRQRIANLMIDHVLPFLERPEPWKRIHIAMGMNESDVANLDDDAAASAAATRQVMAMWTEAFEAALREYAIFMSEKDQSEAPLVYKTYSSIEEASLLLKKILDNL